MTNQNVAEVLNKIIATQNVFYTKLHQVHWYVKGSHFFTLHEQFEDFYEEVAKQFDEVAERLITIGGEPYSTLQEFIGYSDIKEDVKYKELKQDEMAELIADDYILLSKLLDKGLKIADEEGDDVTNDMLIAQKADVDKHIWMLQAFLNQKIQIDK